GAAAMSAAATFGVAAAPSPPVLALLWFLGGMPVGVLLPVLRALQQRLTPNRLLGRVNTTGRVVTRGMMVVGSLGAGLLAEATSTRVAIAAGAAVQLSAAGLLWVVLRSRDLDTAPPDPTR
ncbi:MAG: MFS transporter, partial [Actinomycetota bacterium]|nr:MFS transporter [Actinomycetota bacterium]